MKREYWWLLGGIVIGTMFGSRIPFVNKLSA